MKTLLGSFFALLLIPGSLFPGIAQSALVERFYRQRHDLPYWFVSGEGGAEARKQLLNAIDSAAWLGLDSNRYHLRLLRALDAAAQSALGTSGRSASETYRQSILGADRQFTGAALDLAREVVTGAGIPKMISYDGVSLSYASRDDDVVLGTLDSGDPAQFCAALSRLEPASPEYAALKAALGRALGCTASSGATQAALPRADTIARLSTALNTLRWIHHFHFSSFILVNIPSAVLCYYVADTIALRMRVVVGEPSKRTPRFAAWVDGLVLYPYWNIPRHIAAYEMLPMFRKLPALAEVMQIQVLDNRGRMLDPTTIQWGRYTAADFPYALRQLPGCENALGVLKFEINSPYDVYMHDTNLKCAFGSSRRFLSHGCIRLQKPFLLGDMLMDHHLDTVVLNSCLRDQRPVRVSLASRVPVFVLYNTVQVGSDGGELQWFKDVYHLEH